MSVEHTLVSVVTAGDVGAIQPRLGISSFDVTASVGTPDELIAQLEAATPPDVILIESTLFPTVEPIVRLAPDALIIAIGDQTPAGALGHVPAGMSGGAIASLVHALLAGGVTAAVAAVEAFEPGAVPSVVDVTTADAGRFVRATSRTTIVTTGAVAASLIAALAWGVTRDGNVPQEVAAPAPTSAPVVQPSPQPSARTTIVPAVTERQTREPTRERERPPAEVTDRGLSIDGPQPVPGQDAEPPDSEPPGAGPGTSDPEPDEREPRGNHRGWEHKPPKHDDQGGHKGWR